jgi:hypothetical protein
MTIEASDKRLAEAAQKRQRAGSGWRWRASRLWVALGLGKRWRPF